MFVLCFLTFMLISCILSFLEKKIMCVDSGHLGLSFLTSDSERINPAFNSFRLCLYVVRIIL